MGRTEQLESWSKAVLIFDFVICGIQAVGLLILMCLPQFIRDVMYRIIDEMDYDTRRKEDLKPFYESVVVPIIWASIAGIILFQFVLALVLAFGVLKPNLNKLNGWIKFQIFLSVLTTLGILVLTIRFLQYFLGFLPFLLYQLYRYASIVIIFKYENALIQEDVQYRKRLQHKMAGSANNNNYTSLTRSGSLNRGTNKMNGSASKVIINGYAKSPAASQKNIYYTQLQSQQQLQLQQQQQRELLLKQQQQQQIQHQQQLIRQSSSMPPSVPIPVLSAPPTRRKETQL